MSLARAGETAPRTMLCLLLPDCEALDVVGPLDVFASANRLAGDKEPYRLELVGRKPGPVRLAGGVRMVAERRIPSTAVEVDTLLVPGNLALAENCDDELIEWLRVMAKSVRRLVSICTGAFFLAAAGLLDGRRATTHWESCPRLARLHPRVRVEPDSLFVKDGPIYTSAGISAGIDLALELVEEDLGRAFALSVAREMVLFLKRPGGQSQFSASLLAQEVEDGRLAALTEWILQNLSAELSIEALADRAHVSPRHLSRLFRRETGNSPAAWVEKARLERARHLLTDSTAPVKKIAAECGFGSSERLRRAFHRHLQLAPSDYRELHRGSR